MSDLLRRQVQTGPQGAISMLDPLTGEYRWIPQTEFAAALKEGYAPETPVTHRARLSAEQEEEEYSQKGIQAFLAGAARGASFGLSDLALTRLGGVEKEHLRKLQEYNPITSAGGDIAGTVGGFLIPGGPAARLMGGAGRVGKLTGAATTGGMAGTRRGLGAVLGQARQATWPVAPGAMAMRPAVAATRGERLLGELVETGTREGLVGAGIGAGGAVSQIALAEQEMTSAEVMQTLVSGAKQGAVVFGGLGVGMKVLGKAGAVVRKHMGRGLDNLRKVKAEATAAEAEVKGLHSIAADQASIVKAEARLAELRTAVSQAEGDVSIRMFGRTAGLGLAYALDGGIGLHALGILAGPKVVRYLTRVVKPMNGPVGSTIKEFQLALKPEAVKAAAKMPLDRAMVGFAVGGPLGALTHVASWRAREALGRVFGNTAIVGKLFPTATEKIYGMADREVGKLFSRMKFSEVLPSIDVDLEGLDTALRVHASASAPAEVTGAAISTIVGAMRHLQEHNPAAGLDHEAVSKIPSIAKQKFMSRYRAIVSPESFIQDFGAMRLKREQVEAWQAAYPQALDQIREVVRSSLDEAKAKGGKFGRDQLRTISTLLGDRSVLPRMYDSSVVARLQKIHQTQQQPSARRGRPPRLAEQHKTPTQRVEGGML